MLHVIVASEFHVAAERLRRFFSHRGYTIELVRSGVECLESLNRTLPAVLVLDWNLPWGGGAGVLACIRETAATASLPVVLLADRYSNELDVEAPVSQCLGNSADIGSLYEAVDRVLDDSGAARKPRFKFQPAAC